MIVSSLGDIQDDSSVQEVEDMNYVDLESFGNGTLYDSSSYVDPSNVIGQQIQSSTSVDPSTQAPPVSPNYSWLLITGALGAWYLWRKERKYLEL